MKTIIFRTSLYKKESIENADDDNQQEDVSVTQNLVDHINFNHSAPPANQSSLANVSGVSGVSQSADPKVIELNHQIQIQQ